MWPKERRQILKKIRLKKPCTHSTADERQGENLLPKLSPDLRFKQFFKEGFLFLSLLLISNNTSIRIFVPPRRLFGIVRAVLTNHHLLQVIRA